MIFWLCWTVSRDCLQIWLTWESQNKGATSKYISISFYYEEENKNDLLTNQTQKASEKVLLYTRAICSQLNILEQSKKWFSLQNYFKNFMNFSWILYKNIMICLYYFLSLCDWGGEFQCGWRSAQHLHKMVNITGRWTTRSCDFKWPFDALLGSAIPNPGNSIILSYRRNLLCRFSLVKEHYVTPVFLILDALF